MDTGSTLNKENAAPLKKGKRGKKANQREAVAGTLMASVPLIGFFIFGFIPLMLALRMAFFSIKGYDILGGKYVGFENFEQVFTTAGFWEALRNTVRLGVSTLISQFFALIIAYFLSKNPKET